VPHHASVHEGAKQPACRIAYPRSCPQHTIQYGQMFPFARNNPIPVVSLTPPSQEWANNASLGRGPVEIGERIHTAHTFPAGGCGPSRKQLPLRPSLAALVHQVSRTWFECGEESKDVIQKPRTWLGGAASG
jgi:hypothetical protein